MSEEIEGLEKTKCNIKPRKKGEDGHPTERNNANTCILQMEGVKMGEIQV